MAKNRSITTLSRTPDELSPEIWGPGLARIEALLGSMQSDLTTQCARANTILADLRRRVEVLESVLKVSVSRPTTAASDGY